MSKMYNYNRQVISLSSSQITWTDKIHNLGIYIHWRILNPALLVSDFFTCHTMFTQYAVNGRDRRWIKPLILHGVSDSIGSRLQIR